MGDSNELILGGIGAPGATFSSAAMPSLMLSEDGSLGGTTALKLALRFSKPAGGERRPLAGDRGRLSEESPPAATVEGSSRESIGAGSVLPILEGGRAADISALPLGADSGVGDQPG